MSKVIIHNDQRSIQKMVNQFYKVVTDKDKEISYTKYHGKRLIANVKKTKYIEQHN